MAAICGAGATAGATSLVASAPYVPDQGSLAIQCGRLIDGLASEPRGPTTVVVRGGRIAELRDGRAAPDGLAVLDLTADTCLPGLIDTHTHITDRPGDSAGLSVFYRRTLADRVAIGRENARMTLDSGVTTVRDVGTCIAWADRALRTEVDAGQVAGPRIQAAGYYLTVPGGGGDLVIPGHREGEIPATVRQGVARGPEQFRARSHPAATPT